MSLMNYEYLLESEAATQIKTVSQVYGFMENFPKIEDALLCLHYFLGPKPDPESADGAFHSWAYHRYFCLPYTVRGIYILWERGLYNEASILLRGLWEVLAQLLWFSTHKDQLNDHLTGKRRISFKAIFNNIAPGFYDLWYGKILSGMVHGGIAASFPRFKYTPPSEAEWTYGCEYDDKAAAFVINQLIDCLHGYLAHLRQFFPVVTFPDAGDYQPRIAEVQAWLVRGIFAQLRTNPKSAHWYDIIGPLIGWKGNSPGAV